MYTAAELYQKLSTSPHHDRVKELLALGRQAKQDTSAAALLSQLSQGDPFAKKCALISCFGSQNGEMILRAVSDPSRMVRGLALRLVVRFCNDAQTIEALQLSQQRRQHMPIIRGLVRRRRFAPIDRFVESLAVAQDPLCADLLAYTSPEVLRRLAPQAFARPGALLWARLSRRNIEIISEHLLEQLQKSNELPDPRLRFELASALPKIVQKAPLRALALLEKAFALNIPEGKAQLQALVLQKPQETFAWLEKQKISFHQASFGPVALQLTHPQLLLLLRDYRSALGEPQQWFTKELEEFSKQSAKDNFLKYWMLAHPEVIERWLERHNTQPLWGAWLFQFVPTEKKEAREKAYEQWSIAARDQFGVISPSIIQGLPWELQEREARRHITEVGQLQTKPLLRLQYYPLLPWVEALEHLKPWLSHPEPEVRIQGMQTFLTTFGTRIQGKVATDSEVQEALELVKSRRFEQDPVRLVMLQALSGWPRSSWKESHLSALGEICQAALDASDLSTTTAHYLGALLQNLFVLDQTRAIAWYLTLYHNRGFVEAAFGGSFSREEVAAIADGLSQIAKKFTERNQPAMMLSLAKSLGLTLASVPGFEGLLRAELLRSQEQSAATLLLLYFREAFDASFQEAYAKCTRKEQKLALLLPCLASCPKEKLSGPLLYIAEQELQNSKWHDQASTILIHFTTHISPPKIFEYLQQLLETKHFASIFVGLLQSRSILLQHPPILTMALALFPKLTVEAYGEGLLSALFTTQREVFREKLPQWLSADHSVAMLRTTSSFLDKERHDLLSPFVTGQRPMGRFFQKAPDRWVFPVQVYAKRWSTSTQDALAQTLDAELADKEKNIPQLIGLVERRVGLPLASATGLFSFASDPRSALKEKVIRLLARLDAGQGLPTLIECLVDDRARFAIYGFRKAVLELPPVAVFELLQRTPLHKVTVAKEIMRLLGEMRSDAAYEFMISLHNTQKLHRDVRIAQLRALWGHLEKPQTWKVFDDAVTDPDWILASKLAELPLITLTGDSEKKMSALFAKLLQRSEPEARVDLLQKLKHLPLVDSERLLFNACLQRCASEYGGEFQPAVEAVLFRARSQDSKTVASFFTALMPKRRQFLAAFSALLQALSLTNYVIKAIAQELLKALRQDPLLASNELQLARHLLSWGEVRETILSFSKKGLLHAETLPEVINALHTASRADAQETEVIFRKHTSPEVRHLGLLLLLRLSATGYGWIPARSKLLKEYQRDPSPLVASVAIRVFPEEK
jgi:hypothetical protein